MKGLDDTAWQQITPASDGVDELVDNVEQACYSPGPAAYALTSQETAILLPRARPEQAFVSIGPWIERP